MKSLILFIIIVYDGRKLHNSCYIHGVRRMVHHIGGADSRGHVEDIWPSRPSSKSKVLEIQLLSVLKISQILCFLPFIISFLRDYMFHFYYFLVDTCMLGSVICTVTCGRTTSSSSFSPDHLGFTSLFRIFRARWPSCAFSPNPYSLLGF